MDRGIFVIFVFERSANVRSYLKNFFLKNSFRNCLFWHLFDLKVDLIGIVVMFMLRENQKCCK